MIESELSSVVTALREEVCQLHEELIRWNLVVWTAGNISARVPGADLLVIKPSGVRYHELTPDKMVVCNLEGKVVEGSYTPSSDTISHAYVYRHMPQVGGIVHTHSSYATAWACRREPIPPVISMVADEFGGEIPVGPLARVGDDAVGRGIVETLSQSRSKAVLMANHGVFTVGKDAINAVKAAAMCEEVAKTVHLARALGEPVPLPQDYIDFMNDRYQNGYGQ